MSRHVFHRVGWGITDQALSSLTNFALGLLVARSVSPTGFGAFSLAFATFVVSLGLSRGLASEPLAVRYSHESGGAWRWGAGAATGAALTAGAVLGAVCVIVGGILGKAGTGTLTTSFVALGLSLPGLLVQDCWRYAFFANGHGRSAFVNDAVCAVVLFIAFATLEWFGHSTVFWLILAWGGAASVGAVVGVLQARVVPAPQLFVTWCRTHADLIPRYLGEAVASSGGGQLSVYGVGAVGGLSVVGALRAAHLLFGPIQVLFTGVGMMSVPELVRVLRRSAGQLYVAGGVLSLTLAVVATTWGLGIGLMPNAIGGALLGSTWRTAHPLAPIVMIGWIGSALGVGAAGGMRALAAAKRGLTARLVGATAALAGAIAGAAFAGASGAAAGLAFAGCVEAVASWWQFRCALRQRASAAGTSAVPDTVGFIARRRAMAQDY
jgi:O-antigen/teichoic acid export membrane protein